MGFSGTEFQKEKLNRIPAKGDNAHKKDGHGGLRKIQEPAMAVGFPFIASGRLHRSLFVRFNILPDSRLTPVVQYAIFKQMFLCNLHD